ncbi:MAG TPA: ATP-binding protein [Solirubrobacteraceae bacterium]|nr:ATP-binding protein [Solirubrobacteraceae bacterium]
MGRFSIARSLRLALVGLAIALASVAAAGIASLYSARQSYENVLARSSDLGTAVANLTSAGVVQVEIAHDATGPLAPAARRQAAAAFDRSARAASALAASDPASARLLARQISLQRLAVAQAQSGRLKSASAGGGTLASAATVADQLQARQRVRQDQASDHDRSKSRDAITIAIVAGVLALIAALILIAGLVRSMRRPLDELVGASGELASGRLERRVQPGGPRELRELGLAFNAMADDLASAQRRIEDERRRLAVTIESLGDGLIVTESASSAIATMNPRAAELIHELAPGRSVDDPASPLPTLHTALEREVVIDHAGRILAVTAAAMGDDTSSGIVWTVRDVTERARLERAKSDFVATASHELRSPLTSIKGFVELLERSPDRMSARQLEFLDIIKRSTDRLVELVNDLLDVARLEADHVEINARPIDVGEAVQELAELMGPRILAKHQTLGTYVAPALPLAMADPERIRQVIGNLLTNAHLYTGEGGRIHIGVEADRAWVRIVVADTGIGMSAEETERAFERFYRARSGNESAPGTGLGLSIVKSLVDLHHGLIEVDSEPGRGTTFHVRIPAAVAAENADSLGIIQGRRVLIVDDESEVAELIADQLASLDVDTTIATSGEEALVALRGERFDAVTLDILMPDMDGFEVLRQIRADPDLRATPIVFVSVFSARTELSGEWVVAKPIDAAELRQVLAAAVRGGRSRVLIVGREELQPTLEPAMDELGIEHHWETSGAAAARVCGERRFEVALIDVGIRNPQAVLQALDLRGRRLRRAVILFSDGGSPTPSGIVSLGLEVVPVQDAANALLSALRGDREQASRVAGGAEHRG